MEMVTNTQLEQFRAMARAGATPEQVAAFAKTQHESIILVIQVLRSCFDIDFTRAKEIAIYAVRGITFEQHFQELFPDFRFIMVLIEFEQKYGRQISDDEAAPLFQHLLEREKRLDRELSDDEIMIALESNLT